MVSHVRSRFAPSSRQLLWLISRGQHGLFTNAAERTGRCSYSTTTLQCARDKNKDDDRATPPSDSSNKSKQEPIKLANILQHASQKSKALLNGINGSSQKNHHPAHHFVAGGTPCDPAPPPFHLAEYGEDSLYTLVLLRHGESEWNALNRKCVEKIDMRL